VLRAEAAWLAGALERLPADDLSPLLSIGSGAPELRATQPWIQRLVYEPLARRGVRVLHHELHQAAGVDVAGDLTDPRFLERLDELEIRSIMCCNVLEHVPTPGQVASALERAVAPGGYALVSVPRRYPYHPGPIDTLFRPTVDELRGLFPRLGYESGAEIRCESLARYLLSSSTKWASLIRGFRTHAPAEARMPLRETLRMGLLSTAVSAVVLRAPVGPSSA
jgi:SAM-dependent methyltransferase